jgi:hypothetical protein
MGNDEWRFGLGIENGQREGDRPRKGFGAGRPTFKGLGEDTTTPHPTPLPQGERRRICTQLSEP